jgi:hypothetical protein
MMTQSGLQAAYGGYTDKVPRSPFRQPDPKQKALGKAPGPLLLLGIYGLAVVVGIVTGLMLPMGWLRLSVVGVASAVAFLVLLLQGQFGFPIADSIAQENVALAKQYEEQKVGALTRGPPVLVLHHTWWYYGAFALPVAALIVVVAEVLLNRRKTKKPNESLQTTGPV